MKKLLVVLALTWGSAGAANTTQAVTLVTTDGVNYSADFTFDHTAAFTDTIVAQLPGRGVASAVLNSVGFTTASNIDFTSVRLGNRALDITNGITDLAVTSEDIMLPGGEIALRVEGRSGSNASYAGTLFYRLASAVPEPAAWMMMALGFGLIGVTIRRRPVPRTA